MNQMREEYERLNNTIWPAEVPKLTGPEAVTAFKRLYRKFVGHPYRGKIILTSGNRRNRRRNGVLSLNPDRGWRSFCHGLSHTLHRLLYRDERPHSQRHLDMEFAVVRYVKEQGWLEGKLKRPEKPKVAIDVRKVRYDRVLKRLTSWRSKLKRAETAIKKLEHQRRYYERSLAANDDSQEAA